MSTDGIFGADRAFTAEINANGIGTVLIGGCDVTNHVRGFRYAAEAGRTPRTELHLAVFDATRIESASTEVFMHPGTRELLLAAGWLPPPAQGWDPASPQHAVIRAAIAYRNAISDSLAGAAEDALHALRDAVDELPEVGTRG